MTSPGRNNRALWIVAVLVWICTFLLPLTARSQNTVNPLPEPAQTSSAINNTDSTPTAKSPMRAAPDKNPSHASSAQKSAKSHSASLASNHSSKAISGSSSEAAAPLVPGVTSFSPEKTVIRNGGARELRLQLTPTTSVEQSEKQRRQTRDLLSISNDNLKRISQLKLDKNQQDMLQEVHNYVEQARLADKAGELQRAQSLASKARQLSDDLAGVRAILKLWPW